MSTDLAAVVAGIQSRASYLRCTTASPSGDGWIGCADLIGNPDRLRAEIASTAVGRGTDDQQVAASLYTQAYAFRLPSIAVAAFALGLPAPTTAPGLTAIRIGRHRPAEVAILDSSCSTTNATALATELFEGHLVPFVAAVRTGTRVGERLLWGNVAASIATIFRALDVAPYGDTVVRARAAEFEQAASRWLSGLGSYSTIATADAAGWYWTRTNCCLWYQTSSGFYCDDCSLRTASELAAKRLAELIESTPT